MLHSLVFAEHGDIIKDEWLGEFPPERRERQCRMYGENLSAFR